MPPGPMPAYDVPGLIKVEMHFIQDQQRVMNSYWVNSNLHETSDTHMHEVANTFKNWWTGSMRGRVTNNVSLFEVVAKELRPDGLAVLETDGLPSVGGWDQPAMPNNVTLAVHWGTGHIGRSTHGRTYHIGLAKDQVTNNTCTAASTLQGIYDGLRTTLDSIALNVEFSVVSFVHANAWRATPLITPITGVSVENTIDNMRRRLPGRGQ